MNKQKQNKAVLLGLIIIAVTIASIIVVDNTTYRIIIGIIGLVVLWLALRFALKKQSRINIKQSDYNQLARDLIVQLGGASNITEVNACQTRVLLSVNDSKLANIDEIRKLGIAGVLRPSNTKVQLIVKELVEPIANALRKELNHD